jgi:uncharacterized damage-inducible protein DinB
LNESDTHLCTILRARSIDQVIAIDRSRRRVASIELHVTTTVGDYYSTTIYRQRVMTSTSTLSPALDTESPASILFADVDGELATTRRMLERIPDGKEDWRPHPKSRSLGELATHVAQLPGFGVAMLSRDEFDVGQGFSNPKTTNTAERLALFDQVSAEFRRLLQEMTWSHARSTWTMRLRNDTLFQGPRANLVRSAFITHSAHHRAQLGVYLRLLDLSVPSSYGPTADEGLPPA